MESLWVKLKARDFVSQGVASGGLKVVHITEVAKCGLRTAECGVRRSASERPEGESLRAEVLGAENLAIVISFVILLISLAPVLI